MDIPPFTKGPFTVKQRLNDLIQAVNNLNRMVGDEFILVKRTPTAITFSLSTQKLLERMRMFSMGGAGATKVYARIVQSLTRGNAEQEIEPRSTYRIQLLGDEATPDWSEDEIEYVVDDVVKVEAEHVEYYTCTKAHTSDADVHSYRNTTFWELTSEYGLEAWVDGFDGDLLRAAPWFAVDQAVEVYSRADFDSTGAPTGTAKWRICETVFPTESLSGNTYRYSIAVLEDEQRVAAVFG